LKEALEANDWEGGDGLDLDIDLDILADAEEDNDGSIDFGIDSAEMETEMAGMKQAIYGGGNADEDGDGADEEEADKEVEQLQAMMLKMQAVRGMICHNSVYNALTNSHRYGGRSARSRTEEVCCQSSQ
jgi:hypothetical protein